MAFRTGERVGRYDIRAFVASGGMASVWLAWHRDFEVHRALKVLHQPDPSMIRRFFHEGRLGVAHHPHLVQVHELLDHEGQSALVMEYVDGPTLGELLALRAVLTVAEVDALAVELFRAITGIHERRLVHRDLKPSNVLLCTQGGRLTLKVGDFGIAKSLGDSAGVTGVHALGSPPYMSPEQYAHAADVDHRADLFALGCVLYELVSGRRVFQHIDAGAARAAIELGRYDPVRTHRPDAPERMVRTIDALLRPDRAERPPDCAAVAASWAAPDPAQMPWRDADRAALDHLRARRHVNDDRLLLSAAELAPVERRHVEGCIDCRNRRRAWTPSLDETPHEAVGTAQQTFPVERRSQHDSPEVHIGGPRLFGREPELAAAAKHLADGGRLLALVGPGGVGKSRLAAEIARRWQARMGGALAVCDLAEATDSDGVVRALGRSVGPPFDPTHGSVDGPSLLVVLDNCDRVLDALALWVNPWLAASAQVRVVLTSRELTRLTGEHPLAVEPLVHDDALALFVAAIQARSPQWDPDARVGPRRNLDAIDEIVRRVDALPLAMELLACRVPQLGAPETLNRLDRLLADAGGGRRDWAPRHASVQAAFDWSWSLLSPAERSALGQCTVFRGGFTLEAAEAVIGVQTSAVEPMDLLLSLLDKSLLRVDATGRYQMLEAVRSLVASRMAPAEREGAAERHRRYYHANAALDPLAEIENQIAAARSAVHGEDEGSAAEALIHLARVLDDV